MAYKTCPDCGSRIFEHGCVNCNEADYISMQEPYGEDRFRQVVGGTSYGKEFMSKCKAGDDQRFYLSTEGYPKKEDYPLSGLINKLTELKKDNLLKIFLDRYNPLIRELKSLLDE